MRWSNEMPRRHKLLVLASASFAVLMTLFQTMPGDVRDTGIYHGFTADLSAFNGQTVRIRFAEVDNQYFFNVGIDDVSVIAQADPI